MASEQVAPSVIEAAGDGAGDLPRMLAVVEGKVSARLAGALEAAGSTIEQWRILSLLADQRGHTMTELAEYALLPAASLTRIVDRMVAANLVHRTVDEQDRRRVLALLTTRGRTVYRSLRKTMTQQESELSALLDDAQELYTLLARADQRLS